MMDEQVTSVQSSQITDWSKCMLCQTETKEPLICPAKSKRDDSGAGYRSMAENIVQFHELDCMPMQITLTRLDNGHGIETTLIEEEAKWHKSCSLKVNKTKLERVKDRKRKTCEEDACTSKKAFTRQSSSGRKTETLLKTCFFCSKGETEGKLHEVCTFQLDNRVRKCAHDLQDQELLAKLSTGDLIAIEAKYHAKCLAHLYNRARGIQKEVQDGSGEKACHGIALAELLSYIEDSRSEADVKIFRMADLLSLYSHRLQQLGVETGARINSTHLKDRILTHLPGISAYKKGRDVFLAYEEDVGTVLWQGYQDCDEQSITMTKIANMIRNDIFSKDIRYTGTFDQRSQVNSVPQSLLSLVSMIINGSNIKEQHSNMCLSQPVLTIAQLLVFNCIKRRRDQNNAAVFHSQIRETPLPVYVGLKVHALTRQRQIIDSLYSLGISDSYDRIMDIVTALGNNVCEYYQQIDLVCPPQLQKGQFVTAAADNIDHNPSSVTSVGSFHGTSISLFQNISTDTLIDEEDRGFTRSIGPNIGPRKVTDLPVAYTSITPTDLPSGDIYVPASIGEMTSQHDTLNDDTENDWLEHVQQCHTDDISSTSNISWAAYHASHLPEPETLPSINAMLPLFAEEASSSAMLRHCFDVVQGAVQHLNPGQIPVISIDQPLFAKMKQLQWCINTMYGEDKFVLLLGGLHTELTSFKLLGHWLEGSGWVEALQEAQLATPGVAESFLKASHIARTRHAHQVTACALFILMKKAHSEYTSNNPDEDPPLTFENWCSLRKTEIPQFLYWFTCLELELLALKFVRSLRTGNFDLYVDTLTKLAPWFFSLNHTNYARWMPVHIRDMCSLDEAHPTIAKEFRDGKFVMAKSNRKFSLIAIDHGHEQNNGKMKGDGGIIGLTQDSDALLRWAVAGPELVRVTSEFESSIVGKTEQSAQVDHHEQTESHQKRFTTQVQSLVRVIESMGNPFEEDSNELLRLHSRDIMEHTSVECLAEIKTCGQQQYDTFVRERLDERVKPISAPITRNKVVLFNEQPQKPKNKSQETVTLLKSEASLFARLYVACQKRDGDLDTFFSHENQPFPPSLSSYGQLRQGKKSDLLDCLQHHTTTTGPGRPPTDVTIFDGAVLVNMLRPIGCKTFKDYASDIFIPYITKEYTHACRVDIVWDTYTENSLKSQIRGQRGSGQRRRVEPASPTPKNWQQFLRVDANKTELFKLLNSELMTITLSAYRQELILTDGPNVMCIPMRDTSRLAPCNHEEADSRMMVHIADASMRGFNKISVRTVDTDVVVLAVATVQQLDEVQLWIAFGTGKDFRYIPVHEICASLGPQRSLALPVFHAFTGCDTVSSFTQIGKKTAWKVWEAHDEFTAAFYVLHNSPTEITRETHSSLERFTILLYDRTSTASSINETRKTLFTRKGRQMASLPPTKAALEQHIRRTALQGGHYWGSATERHHQLPSPGDWGWTCPERWQPLWTTLPQASASCSELISCKCRTLCRNCKCTRAQLKCTLYCSCQGACENI